MHLTVMGRERDQCVILLYAFDRNRERVQCVIFLYAFDTNSERVLCVILLYAFDSCVQGASTVCDIVVCI